MHELIRIETLHSFRAGLPTDALAHERGVDAGIDDQMRDMDVFGPELPRHALRHRAQAGLGAGERRIADAAANAGGSAGKENAAFAVRQHHARGLAAGLKLPAEMPPWLAVWNQLDRMVKDKADNTNNRFGVGSEINRRLTGGPFPFWGVPPKDALTTLQPKKTRAHGAGDIPEFRYERVTGDERERLALPSVKKLGWRAQRRQKRGEQDVGVKNEAHQDRWARSR